MIPAERAHLNVAAVSHPGMSGKNNEDRYSISAFSNPQDSSQPNLLAIIADGIGGHRAGEIAAEIAIETISQNIAASDASQPTRTLQAAIQEASQAIYQQAQSDTNQLGMGSTCACCWIIGNRLYTATVGDSRIYLVRNGAIHQISTDHTWVQEAIDQGDIDPGQARNHPNAHVIRRYLGSRQPVIPDLRLKLNTLDNDQQAEANQGFTLQPEDLLLLCSDGLTDLVEDQEILSYLKNRPMETALEQLVAVSNQRGGHDNITIIGLQIPDSSRSFPPASPGKTQGRNWAVPCAVVLGIALIAALLIGSIAMGYLKLAGPKVTGTPTVQSSPAPAILPTRDILPTSTGESILPVNPTLTLPPTRTPNRTPLSATLTPWPTNTPPPQ